MDRITVKETVAGDVLLYHGNSLLSKLIRFFDGTVVNHAAICIGEGRLGEAQAKGLAQTDIEGKIKKPEYIIVRRLKVATGTMQPVIDKAEYYLNVGNRYAFAQIVLLAFLGLSRKLQVNNYLTWLLRKILDEAADWITANGDKQPMICSEFVYRCYDEALPAEHDLYSLNIEKLPTKGRTRKTRAMTEAVRRYNIQRDSLLDWVGDMMANREEAVFSARLGHAGERGIKRAARLSREDEKMSSMPLDDLISHYLEETRKPARRSLRLPASLRSPEMLASIEKFSGALYATAKKPSSKLGKRRSTRGIDDQVTAGLSHLLKTAADFVTPGDLLKCVDLYNVGRISP
jgi:hypothetical protein